MLDVMLFSPLRKMGASTSFGSALKEITADEFSMEHWLRVACSKLYTNFIPEPQPIPAAMRSSCLRPALYYLTRLEPVIAICHLLFIRLRNRKGHLSERRNKIAQNSPGESSSALMNCLIGIVVAVRKEKGFQLLRIYLDVFVFGIFPFPLTPVARARQGPRVLEARSSTSALQVFRRPDNLPADVSLGLLNNAEGSTSRNIIKPRRSRWTCMERPPPASASPKASRPGQFSPHPTDLSSRQLPSGSQPCQSHNLRHKLRPSRT
jgi:hypothetical protein